MSKTREQLLEDLGFDDEFDIDESSGWNPVGEWVVQDARFERPVDDPYNRMFLFLDVAPYGSGDDGDESSKEIRYSVGKGWETPDGGTTIKHVDGKKKLHGSTNLGLLWGNITGQVRGYGQPLDVARNQGMEIKAGDYEPNEDGVLPLQGMLEWMRSSFEEKYGVRPSQRDSRCFIGQVFDFSELYIGSGIRTVEVDELDEDGNMTGETVEEERKFSSQNSYPVAWIGHVDDVGTEPKAEKKTAAKKPGPKKRPPVKKKEEAVDDQRARFDTLLEENGVDGDADELYAVLEAADDYDDFVGAAMDVDLALENTTVNDLVFNDSGFYDAVVEG